MLKFIRRFQLIILAIGGSLLMVVFLLEPVLTSFQRSQQNRTVARWDDGVKITLLDLDRAKSELELARRAAPVVFQSKQQGGLGLQPGAVSDDDRFAFHWLMLARMAEEAGLVGGAEDGRRLVDLELQAEIGAAVNQIRFAIMQGVITPEEAQSQLEQFEQTRRAQINREVAQSAGFTRGATEDDMWRSLARFTGAYRLLNLYLNAPAFSPAGAVQGARALNDAVAVDAVVIDGSVLAGSIPDPGDEALAAFFQPRAGLNPAEDPNGVGYLQPARIRLGWLVLDREQIYDAVPVDRVELQKMWSLDNRKPEGQRQYPGDLSSERPRIEADYRAAQTDLLMVEADKLIRSEVITATRGLDRQSGRLILPANWADLRPRLDTIAERVVTGLATQGVNLPTPTVEIMDNRLLSAENIAALPGFGRSFYRIGSRTVLMQQLPEIITAMGVAPDLNLQVGVPQVDPAAVDQNGNRYYAMVFEHLPAGPARSIDDVGRERILADYRALEGYRQLESMLDTLLATAEGADGLRGSVDLAMESADPTRVVRPRIANALRVSSLQVQPGRTGQADPRLNMPAFRDAVLAASADLDPLVDPETLVTDPRAVAVALPQSRSVAIARIIAPRPLTAEQFATNLPNALAALARREMQLGIESQDGRDPFGFEALRERYDLRIVGEAAEQPAVPAPTPGSEPGSDPEA
jgi:hypothetical protein